MGPVLLYFTLESSINNSKSQRLQVPGAGLWDTEQPIRYAPHPHKGLNSCLLPTGLSTPPPTRGNWYSAGSAPSLRSLRALLTQKCWGQTGTADRDRRPWDGPQVALGRIGAHEWSRTTRGRAPKPCSLVCFTCQTTDGPPYH